MYWRRTYNTKLNWIVNSLVAEKTKREENVRTLKQSALCKHYDFFHWLCVYFYSIIPSSFERPLYGTKNPNIYGAGIWQPTILETVSVWSHFGLAG